MKILEINTEKTWRGGERQTLFALKGFRMLGQEVHLLAREGFSMIEQAIEEKFTAFKVRTHLGVIPFLIKNGRNYDVIHVQTASLLTFAVLTKPFHHRKVVYTRRLDFVPKGYLTKWKYNSADLIVVISGPIKIILEKFGVKNMTLIPECIEEKQLNQARALEFLKQNGLEGKKVIGTTAALVQHKDPQTLVKAIESLSKLRNDFVLLHFGDGILKAEIESMIAEKNLGHVYKLTGFWQNVEDFFSIFDVFVMSSEEEGLGSSVLDAFIYKVPVVSTNAGGLAEIIAGRGSLVNVKDHEALGAALNNAIDNPDKLQDSISGAYQYAKEVLNIENIHKKYMECFGKLINKKGQL